MNQTKILILFLMVFFPGCYEVPVKKQPAGKINDFVFQETIAKGQDTGMVKLGRFRRVNIADILCQHWQIELPKSTADVKAGETGGDFSFTGLVLFKDSSAVKNPFGKIQFGRWQLTPHSKPNTLMLSFPDSVKEHYIIDDISSANLSLSIPGSSKLGPRFVASGQTHHNMYNEPFHILNNQWRIKPLQKETDSAIHQRIKNCLRFFALYYRDHIKRQAETISFKGLPTIFKWYSGGIGLPDKDELSKSWVDCFYNKDQAITGYLILRTLIVDYEFKWPKNAPSWVYQTHSVLEQMYHKIDNIR